MIAAALARSAGSSLALMALLVKGETSSAPDVVDGVREECLVGQRLPLQVQLNTGASGRFRGDDGHVAVSWVRLGLLTYINMNMYAIV